MLPLLQIYETSQTLVIIDDFGNSVGYYRNAKLKMKSKSESILPRPSFFSSFSLTKKLK